MERLLDFSVKILFIGNPCLMFTRWLYNVLVYVNMYIYVNIRVHFNANAEVRYLAFNEIPINPFVTMSIDICSAGIP